MQTWQLAVLGILSGFAMIGSAVFVATMLGRGNEKPWMAEPSGRDPYPDINTWDGSMPPD